MNADLSLMGLFLNASLVVQAVMVLLFSISVISWVLIFQKIFSLRQLTHACEQFEDEFWSGVDLKHLYQRISASGQSPSGTAAIFFGGFKEFARLHGKSEISKAEILEGSQRAMRVAYSREADKLSTFLSFLATVGSTSPYVGLFGTVWGIMNSFRALGQANQATLAMVAPGIAEALVATAIGLFAAIPAVVAYNRFASDSDRILARAETFMDEFSSILHRRLHR